MGSYLILNGQKIHSDCFRCNKCGSTIEGTYTENLGKYYHPACYQNMFGLKCDLCGNYLNGEYIIDDWGNKICHHHNIIEMGFCDSCGKALIHKKVNYDDGRSVCKQCYEIRVSSSNKAIQELLTVVNLFKEKGIKYNYPDIKVFLTSQKYINTNSNHIGTGKLRGLCSTQMKGVSLKHNIFILNGLPDLEFRGVLAHELLHAWLFENKITLQDDECEGFCNLGSALVYKRSKTELGKVLFKNLENDTSPIYGDGFRKMKVILENKGWKSFLKYVESIKIN